MAKISNELVRLVVALTEGTTKEKLPWTATADEGVFRLVLQGGLIRIGRRDAGTDAANGEHNGSGARYSITVLNREGAVLMNLDDVRENEFSALAGLYNQVEGRSRQETFDEILSEIQQLIATSSGVKGAGVR